MRVISLLAIVASIMISTLRADVLSLHPARVNTPTIGTSANVSRNDKPTSSDQLYHHSFSVRQDNACSRGAFRHGLNDGRCGDPSGSVDGYPGGCGEGPGRCGSLWNTYCRDRKPCWSPPSHRRHWKLYWPSFGCRRPLTNSCWTTHSGKCLPMPSFVIPCIKKPNFPAFVGIFHSPWGDGDVPERCDEDFRASDQHVREISLPSSLVEPSAPSSVDQHSEHDSGDTPPADSAPAATRSFFPFSLNSPPRDENVT